MLNLRLEGYFGEDITLEKVKEATASVPDSGINVIINSSGGEIIEAILITDYLESLNVPLMTTAIKVASAATWPFFRIQDRELSPEASDSWLFIHEVRLDPEGLKKGELFTADQLIDLADRLEEFNALLATIYADSMGISIDEARELMSNETWFDKTEATEIYKIVALYKDDDTMNTEKAKGLLKRFADVLSKKGIKASEVNSFPLANGGELKTEGLTVGNRASFYKDGIESEIKDGAYKLSDGRTVIVQWGCITYVIGDTIEAIDTTGLNAAAKAALDSMADPAADPDENKEGGDPENPADGGSEEDDTTDYQAKYNEATKANEELMQQVASLNATIAELKKDSAETGQVLQALQAKIVAIENSDIIGVAALPEGEAKKPVINPNEAMAPYQHYLYMQQLLSGN